MKRSIPIFSLLITMILVSCSGSGQQVASTLDTQKAVQETLDAIRATRPTPTTPRSKAIDDFENSQFCTKYGCVAYETRSEDGFAYYPYMIGNYPKSNDFLIEINTENGVIFNYGISLDPTRITEDELELIEIFLSSFKPGDFSSEIMDFVEQNLDNDVFQICLANSIQFGNMRIWVGRVGSMPTVVAANNCTGTGNIQPTVIPTSTPIPAATQIQPTSESNSMGTFGNPVPVGTDYRFADLGSLRVLEVDWQQGVIGIAIAKLSFACELPPGEECKMMFISLGAVGGSGNGYKQSFDRSIPLPWFGYNISIPRVYGGGTMEGYVGFDIANEESILFMTVEWADRKWEAVWFLLYPK